MQGNGTHLGQGVAGPPRPASVSPSLLLRLRVQEPAAWRQILAVYGKLVYGWCRRDGLQPADAADVVQDVFRAVARGIPHFRHDRPGDSFRGWLWGITSHKLADHWRRHRREPLAPGGTTAQERLLQQAADDASGAARSAGGDEGGERRRVLEAVRSEFTAETWQAFWQVVVESRAPAEVAVELGMTRNAVYVAKSRVLARLRERFGDLMDW